MRGLFLNKLRVEPATCARKNLFLHLKGRSSGHFDAIFEFLPAHESKCGKLRRQLCHSTSQRVEVTLLSSQNDRRNDLLNKKRETIQLPRLKLSFLFFFTFKSDYSVTGTTAPDHVSKMNACVSSDCSTATNVLIASLSSSPDLTAITFA